METADHPTQDVKGSVPAFPSKRLKTASSALIGRVQPLIAFWTKINNDWIFNLAGLLAYNFLMSLFPILLVLLAGVGLFLGDQAPETLARMQAAIERLIPGGGVVFEAVSAQLASSAGLLLLIGLGMSLFAGSRLFVVLENCFGIVFRVRGRDFVAQNLMAFGMLALYLLLVSVIMLGSTIPVTLFPVVGVVFSDSARTLTLVLSFVTSLAAALVLMTAVYAVVPNRRSRAREVWPGALIATVLLVLYELLFPRFVTLLVNPASYGAIAAFAIVILVFFYYLGFIVLLGAEINAWVAGRRTSAGDLAASMHELRVGPRPPAPPETSGQA